MQTATIQQNYTINTLGKTKKEIVTRLFKEGHIDLDEVMELMHEPSVQVNPVAPAVIPYPFTTPWTVMYL